jgi:hypothetical protein
MHRFLLAMALVCLTGAVAMAQDPVKVDPIHYKVVSENSKSAFCVFTTDPTKNL